MKKVTINGNDEKKKILPLVMVLANRILNELGVLEKINELVKWDENRWNVSPGALLKILILSTFLDIRAPLMHIQNRFEGIDIGYLIGEEIENAEINESNIGRALERLGESDYNGMYETVALSAIQMNDISMTRLHSDTTTVSFYGEYDESELELSGKEKEELLKIERGYNKDGRPQCNQVVVGQIVNEAGIPIVSRTMDGSTADVDWNKEALNYLEKILDTGFEKGIYVADSKLVINELVTRMTQPEKMIHFVSRCPASFENKLESRMIDKAYETEDWEELGTFHDRKGASVYKGKSIIEAVCGSPMRLLVLRSSSLEQKAKIALTKKEEKLQPLIKELEKKTFACLPDAEKEKERFCQLKQIRLFDCSFEIVQETKEKWPKGRRGKHTKPKITQIYRIHVKQKSQNEEACAAFLRSESCFVVISNVTDTTTNKELLQIYKGQQVVENSFRILKQPQLASVIYLKNPIRVQALTMLLTLALLVRAIIQYKLRDGLKTFSQENPESELRIGWNNCPLTAPTFKLLYESSVQCEFVKENTDEYSFTWVNEKTCYKVTMLLKLMGLSLECLLE